MSDGPHRSLKMSRSWKKVAECADNPAYNLENISEAIVPAINDDWRKEVSAKLVNSIRDVLGEDLLFPNDTAIQLESLRKISAGRPLGSILIDYTIQAVLSGISGDKALQGATLNALIDRAARCARQVEEHYFRESTSPRSVNVRSRIEQGILGANFGSLASRLLDPDSKPAHRSKKHDGLDDGIAL